MAILARPSPSFRGVFARVRCRAEARLFGGAPASGSAHEKGAFCQVPVICRRGKSLPLTVPVNWLVLHGPQWQSRARPVPAAGSNCAGELRAGQDPQGAVGAANH